MKTMSLLWCAGFGVMTMLSGCGGGDGGSCGNTPGCGGDIVGTWTIASSCVTIASTEKLDPSCPGLSVDAVAVTVAGNVTYNADLTFSNSLTVSGSVTETLPASCLTSNGITITCAQLTQALANTISQGGAPFRSAACSGSSSCTCTLVLNPDTSTETGRYTTTGAGVLTETSSGGTVSQSDYCVKGNTLTDSPHQMSGMASSGTITLVKQ